MCIFSTTLPALTTINSYILGYAMCKLVTYWMLTKKNNEEEPLSEAMTTLATFVIHIVGEYAGFAMKEFTLLIVFELVYEETGSLGYACLMWIFFILCFVFTIFLVDYIQRKVIKFDHEMSEVGTLSLIRMHAFCSCYIDLISIHHDEWCLYYNTCSLRIQE